jgi:hypothetical protein
LLEHRRMRQRSELRQRLRNLCSSVHLIHKPF